MLNRRAFCKTLTTLGMGMLLPTLRPTDSSIVPATHTSTGAVGSATYRISGPPGSATATAQDVAHQNSVLNSLLELERCADLLDDLDCIEIVTNYVGLTEFSRCVGDTNYWRTYCPFCDQRNLRSLEVGTEYFRCDWCDATGSAIDCYARIEGLSHREASFRLETLLKEGTLVGHRPEYEHAWDLMAKAQHFYHRLLIESSAGSVARAILEIYGIATSTIERCMLGYAPADPVDLLSRDLLDAGYAHECLGSVCVKSEDGSRTMVDRYGGGHLLIPIRDSLGRGWGFFQKRLLPVTNNFDMRWSQNLLAMSERRRRRLLYPTPSWPRDFHRYESVLLARSPWEIIALQNAGIENVVYMLHETVANDPIARRTLLAMTRTVVCGFDNEGNGPSAAYGLIDEFIEEPERLLVMTVPHKGGIFSLLSTDGAAAVRTAIDHAVPFHQWMG